MRGGGCDPGSSVPARPGWPGHRPTIRSVVRATGLRASKDVSSSAEIVRGVPSTATFPAPAIKRHGLRRVAALSLSPVKDDGDIGAGGDAAPKRAIQVRPVPRDDQLVQSHQGRGRTAVSLRTECHWLHSCVGVTIATEDRQGEPALDDPNEPPSACPSIRT